MRRATVGEHDDWGRIEHLLATVIDVVQHWGYMQVVAATGTKQLEQPEPFSRPGTGPARTELSKREIDARLRAQLHGR